LAPQNTQNALDYIRHVSTAFLFSALNLRPDTRGVSRSRFLETTLIKW